MKEPLLGYAFNITDTVMGWVHGIAWTKTLYQWFDKDGRPVGPEYVYDENQDRYYPWYA